MGLVSLQRYESVVPKVFFKMYGKTKVPHYEEDGRYSGSLDAQDQNCDRQSKNPEKKGQISSVQEAKGGGNIVR